MLNKRTKIIIAVIVVAVLFVVGFCYGEYDFWCKIHEGRLAMARLKGETLPDIAPWHVFITWFDGWEYCLVTAGKAKDCILWGIVFVLMGALVVPVVCFIVEAIKDINSAADRVQKAIDMASSVFCHAIVIAIGGAIAYVVSRILSSVMG